jgi:hypothetical protein
MGREGALTELARSSIYEPRGAGPPPRGLPGALLPLRPGRDIGIGKLYRFCWKLLYRCTAPAQGTSFAPRPGGEAFRR